MDYISNIMIFRHRKYKFLATALICLLIFLPQTALSLAPAPVDYLVPPPLQLNNAAVIRLKTASPQNLLTSESRAIPKFIKSQIPTKPDEQYPGLMTRVARWFGFANQNSVTDQQLTQETNKLPYYYQKPQQQNVGNDKENCFLCNKYPWVPVMQNSIQYPQSNNQWDASKQNQLQTYAQISVSNGNLPQKSFYGHGGQQQQVTQNSYADQSLPQINNAASNIKQRAIKFNFPLPFIPPNYNKIPGTPNQIQFSTGPFLPIPIPPHLSNAALPPLYNAQNFQAPNTPVPNTIQGLPSTQQAHQFGENIAEHSEIHIDTVIPTQIPPTTINKDASFEIVKSHQLVDYVSSIEYPASYVPSYSYDVSSPGSVASALDHQPSNTNVNTGLYQHSTLSPNLSQHVPGSQILTEPGSFTLTNQQQTVQQTDTDESTTNMQAQVFESKRNFANDNYVAASQQNTSVLQQQQPQHNGILDTWTLESNDFAYATSTPELLSATDSPSSIDTEFDTTSIEPHFQDNEIELIASIQTNAQQSNKDTNQVWSQKPKQRETPKRLLDSPIQHVKGNLGAPRPFTRDPSDLTFRLPPSNHKLSETYPATTSYETWKQKISATELPMTSSTFSSIDASGQYAGMVPPSLPSTYNSDQILLPHLNPKNRPRPFESTRIDTATVAASPAAKNTWSQNLSVELHTPQESMLVKSHVKPVIITTTTTTTTKPRTTKYLTKILASNLRELLQREHEPTKLKLKLSPNSLDIDINKLQKNIDDWTEQEYTSLSHRPSTPTIRGRSKHIPSEYLPATTVAVKTRQAKTTKIFSDSSELPSSINNLEPLYERGSTKHYQYTQITDNHLKDFNFESLKSEASASYQTSKTTTPAAPTITTVTRSTATTGKPSFWTQIQIQEPEELWKKAKVSISPKTKEKVYVVTPQPRFFPQRVYTPTPTTAPVSSTTETSLGSGFKSPRFLVRPTPGNDTESKENSRVNGSSAYFSPEWFGLRGLSAYIPAEPVEIIDGNSKVLNIVTPPSDSEKSTQHNIMDLTKDRHSTSKRKSTMAPLPR